jgi:hypothetical protein
MKHFSSFASLCFCVSGVAVGLSGCGGAFPVARVSSSPTLSTNAVGTIQGSDYGGHAPLAGAHIYLVQPSANGYGAVVAGLLTAASIGQGSVTTQNGSWTNSPSPTDQFVPASDANGNPFYGVLADNNGAFNLTGDYTCTVGLPVILIGYGGSPGLGSGSAGSSTNNDFQITTLTVAQSGGNFTYTFTTGVAGTANGATFTPGAPAPELYYPGEQVTFNGFSAFADSGPANGANLAFNNNYSGYIGTVSATGLSTSSFQLTDTSNRGMAAGTYTYNNNNTQFVAGTPVAFNPAAVNLAVLGVCPATGNFSTGATAVRFVYMNEVSTTAAAYAFAGFSNTAATDQTGNDEFHLGVGNAGSVGLHALTNAALTAQMLYDITGSQITTVYAGEGHIANSVTPNGGNGTVPQATLDTIGNILAACVDSNNTYLNGSGVQSPQCLTLFQYAQDNGVYDTSSSTHYAFNIAQAAFNMARFPQGAGTGTTSGGTQTVTPGTATSAANFVSGIYTLPTGNVPFTPHLTSQPNDFGIAIRWSDANANGGTPAAISDLSVDAVGNIWTPSPTGNSTGAVFQLLTNGGINTYTAPLSGTSNPRVAITAASVNGTYPNDSYIPDVYVPGTTGVYQFEPGTSTGIQVDTSGNATMGGAIAIDSDVSPNIMYVASHSNTATSSLVKESLTGSAAGPPFPLTAAGAAENTSAGCMYYLDYLTLDQSSNLWTTDANPANATPGNAICRFNPAGSLQYSYQLDATNPQAHGIAIDRGNNVWYAGTSTGSLYKIAAGSTANNSGVTTQTGGGLNAPMGVAVDGNNTIWVSNTGGPGGIVNYTDANVNLTPNYITAGVPQTDLTYLAVDISGNVWAAATSEGLLIQYVGIATPVATPLALARYYYALGSRP